MSAANWIGMNANQYLHRYGATREMLGCIALNGRANAARNPAAIYRDPMTMDDYLSARPITSPFGLYDCDVPCDASIAVIVSAADVAARPARQPAIRIEAVGTQITERISWDQDTVTHEPQVLGQSAHLWTPHQPHARPTSTSPCSTTASPSTPSRGSRPSASAASARPRTGSTGGAASRLDGELPVNPHGGQLSEGRTHGFGFLYEAITQLRHEAGERQVDGARTAVVTSGGGTPVGRAAAPARPTGVLGPATSKTGSFSQPRTVEVRAWTALSQSTSHVGNRCSTSSSATRPSRRASAAPRQKWMP